jgi:hypothetical protein
MTVELPADTFSRQGGGTQFRVGLPQLMNASFATDNDLQLLGAFGNLDAPTKLIKSRNMVGPSTPSLHAPYHWGTLDTS